MCDNHSDKLPPSVLRNLNPNYFDDVGPHDPDAIQFLCWDARMAGRIHNLPAGKVLSHRSAGATVPSHIEWDPNLTGLFGLASHKGVREFNIYPHSGCLAASMALHHQDPDRFPKGTWEYNNLVAIYNCLAAVGSDMREFAGQCLEDAKGNEELATDGMAKKLACASLSNLMNLKAIQGYTKTVGQAVVERMVNANVVFINLRERRYEHLSLDDMKFHPVLPDVEPKDHMCIRKDNCEGCHCGDQVASIAQRITFYQPQDIVLPAHVCP